jgi:hypothetical protein
MHWEAAAHAELQQTPLTQKPLVHWLPSVQMLPWPSCGWQVPAGPGFWQ